MKTFAGAMSAVLLLALHTCASAAPLYKCEIGGVLAFQDTPCPPLKAKQKIACADADGFAVYQDTLEQACANAPAGAATTNDFSADKKPKSTSTKPTGNATTRKNPSDKEVKEVLVRGYTKEDGTQVPSYTRNLPGQKAKQ